MDTTLSFFSQKLAYYSRKYSRLGQVPKTKTFGLPGARIYYSQMPFLSPNQQWQSTEGVLSKTTAIKKTFICVTAKVN